jgi:DNA-nicking Smr family endonuclease
VAPPKDKSKRTITENSIDAFGDLLGDDVKPLSGKGSAYIKRATVVTPGIEQRRKAAQSEQVNDVNDLDPISVIKQVDPLSYLEYQRPGVQHGVYKNLRMGKYEIQSRLDLHRHSVDQARNAVKRFIGDCHQHSIRCALITHGKGEGRQEPAKLKSCVNHWLRQFNQVLAFHSAQKQHGGLGATYVLIKKDKSAKQRTVEKIDQARRSKN